MTSKERHQCRFDDAFRSEQIGLIEAGELTISDVSRLNDVRWNSVKNWVVKFGKKPYGGVVIQAREDSKP